MPLFLRQSTASQEVPLGYFVSSTDGDTEKTALTINNTDIKIWKTGATTLASKNSGGATHISNGVYYAVLDATDTDTIGPLVIFVHVATGLAVRVECCVLDEAVYDVLFGTTALSTLAGTAQTGDAFARLGAPAGASVSADVAAVKSDTAAIKAKTDSLTFTVANQVDSNVIDWKGAAAPAMTGDAYARLGAPAGVSVSADIAAVKAVDDAVKAKTDSLTFTVANQVDANVVDWKGVAAPAMTGDAYARLGAPAGASVSADIAAVKAVDDAIKAKTDNLPAAPAAVSDIPTATANADALLDRADAIETGWTLRKVLRIVAAALCGKSSGGPGSPVYRSITDAKDRITGVADSDGNRTTSTLDGT